ncbi:MAG: hypothetical protein ACERIH_09925 [Labilibaculum antarcticum]
MKTEDDSIPFTAKFVRTYGTPKWNQTQSYGDKNTVSIIVPISYNENSISSLYYFVLKDSHFDYYLLMNDESDIAYEQSKGIIAYFEKLLCLQPSNPNLFVKLPDNKRDSSSQLKTYRTDLVECWFYFGGTTADPYMYYKGAKCSSSVSSDFDDNRGDWSANSAGSGSVTETPTPANGGGGTGDSDPAPTPIPTPAPAPAPEEPIYSVVEYLDCIDPSLPVTLTIYVDQPIANSNYTVFTSVGHTFVGLTQGDNTVILGFYPKNGAKPTMELDFSILGNDSDTAYDVSITKEITTGQVNAILYYIENYPKKYQLSIFNCTDFGINVAKFGGLNLPDTSSKWLGGEGSNPGNLGQDIRNMQLPNGVNRNLNGGISPSNNKSCN